MEPQANTLRGTLAELSHWTRGSLQVTWAWQQPHLFALLRALWGTLAWARWVRSRPTQPGTKMLKRTIVSMAIFFAHGATSFLVWSVTPGNTAGDGASWATPLWSALSFPVFCVFHSSLVNQYFYYSLLGNSALWAICATLGYSLFSQFSGTVGKRV